MKNAPAALVQETLPGRSSRWWSFGDPVRVVAVDRVGDVVDALAEVEAAVGEGFHAVGYLCYEAAPAFDPALETAPRGALPLTWWGLHRPPEEADPEILRVPAPEGEVRLDWRPLLERSRYEEAIRRIRGAIARGDTYQVNYTFQLEAAFEGDALPLFAALVGAQRGSHAAYVDTGRFAICSASPELFFALEGHRILARPMKGTARRGRHLAEDRARSAELAASEKDRAENVMIVDMVRNDLGRVALPGSLRVDALCEVETYPTVHQLTSTVSAETRAPVTEILRALFPSASITGAPKVATTRIIRELEEAPRGVYTGAVGYLAPGRRAHFNVAIRTATVDRQEGRVRYGTGGGIVWDSDAASEYEECRTKAFVLRSRPPSFELLETLLWRVKSGYFLLERHLDRLRSSAEYFAYPWPGEEIRRRLAEAVAGFGASRTRLRLRLGRDGRVSLEARAWPCSGRTRWTIALDDRPIDPSVVFWFHKTTYRRAYEEALGRRPDVDEVVLWNGRGELTESTRANLVLKVDGEYLTPPLDCGLLPGTYRAELLERGRLREEVLPVEMLDRADEVLLINSVRGWISTRRIPRRPAETDPDPVG